MFWVDVVYGGIRLSPDELAASAIDEDADAIGVSILSGSHLELTRALIAALAARGGAAIPVVVGGIVPAHDVAALTALGVRAIFTPGDHELATIMERILDVIDGASAPPAP